MYSIRLKKKKSKVTAYSRINHIRVIIKIDIVERVQYYNFLGSKIIRIAFYFGSNY